jgi:hypothetical protein
MATLEPYLSTCFFFDNNVCILIYLSSPVPPPSPVLWHHGRVTVTLRGTDRARRRPRPLHRPMVQFLGVATASIPLANNPALPVVLAAQWPLSPSRFFR